MQMVVIDMIKKISLVIPSQNAKKKLIGLLESVLDSEIIPNEIIIVDSSEKNFEIPKSLQSLIKKLRINFQILYGQKLYPGHARNIGITNATNSLITFLDTSTVPSKKWLSSSLTLLNELDSDIIWGNTYYQANTYFSKIIRASTYGAKPIKTLPGSIIRKEVFQKCGLFVESSRAGEDGDWMARSDIHNISQSNPKEFLYYDDLNSFNTKTVLKKWFRNYTYSGRLPHRRIQKDFYFYFISFVAILVAYNWNTVIASWNTESIYFIPNITKLSLAMVILIYVAVRGIFLPKKKGVSLTFIFPFNFLVISFMSACIDFTKALAFGYSRFVKKVI